MQMTRKEKSAIQYMNEYVHAKFGEEVGRNGKRGNSSIAREVVSALVDLYEFHKKYCYTLESVAQAIGCSRTGHAKRIKRFYEKYHSDINFKSKAARIMEQCATQIEEHYGIRLPNGKATQFFTGNTTEASSRDSDHSGYTEFMATLSELDEATRRHCEQSRKTGDDVRDTRN